MDPLSITASVITLIAAVSQSLKVARALWTSPAEFESLVNEVTDLTVRLKDVHSIVQKQPLDTQDPLQPRALIDALLNAERVLQDLDAFTRELLVTSARRRPRQEGARQTSRLPTDPPRCNAASDTRSTSEPQAEKAAATGTSSPVDLSDAVVLSRWGAVRERRRISKLQASLTAARLQLNDAIQIANFIVYMGYQAETMNLVTWRYLHPISAVDTVSAVVKVSAVDTILAVNKMSPVEDIHGGNNSLM